MWRAAFLLLASALPRAAGAEAAAPSVMWREWGREAFDEARRRDRPILLLISAKWSQGERVLEREVLTDPWVRAQLAAEFVPVRVDRERRPDVDRRYQEAAQALSDRGGWPLLAFLTPEGRTLLAASLSTLDDDLVRERPGWRNVLQQVLRDWEMRRGELREKAAKFEESLSPPPPPEAHPTPPPAGLLAAVAPATRAALGESGQGDGPRFPQPQAAELLLTRAARDNDADSLAAARRYAAELLAGGLHDRVSGGFHRMAGGPHWKRPRFEKLLATNAEVLPLLLHLWQATGEASFRAAAEGVLRWTEEALSDRERGGFYAAQAAGRDARSEGAYYTWTVGEVETALGESPAAALVKTLYDVGEWGDLPETAPHRNVLFECLSLPDAAGRAGVPHGRAGALLDEALGRLREARRAAPAPPLDRDILVDANARMVSAYFLAADVLGRSELRAFALKTLDRLLAEGLDAQRGAAHVLEPDGTRLCPCLAADEAALALACEDAFLATGRAPYLQAAEAALARLDEHFRDPADGAYWDRAMNWPQAPEPLGRLKDAHKPFTDAPGPSLNALAALAHLRYAALAGQEVPTGRAAQTLAAFGGVLEAMGPASAALTLAADAAQRGFMIVLIEGPANQARTTELLGAAAATYAPHKLVLRIETGDLETYRRLGVAPVASFRPAAYVVAGKRLVGVAGSAAQLKEAILSAARRP